MDIHKPKPWHGLREFLKEYGIIVLGVLTALALEQAVEAVRVQREVIETREAIHAEIARNAMIAKVSLAENSCSFGLRAPYLAWATGGAKPARSAVPMLPTFSSTVWDTSKLKGVVHMPLREQLSLARYYEFVKNFNDNQNTVKQLGLRLFATFALDKLTSDRADRFREDIASAILMSDVQTESATFAIDSASALKVDPVPVAARTRNRLAEYCHSNGAPTPPLG